MWLLQWWKQQRLWVRLVIPLVLVALSVVFMVVNVKVLVIPLFVIGFSLLFATIFFNA
jgi:hypothetical protein